MRRGESVIIPEVDKEVLSFPTSHYCAVRGGFSIRSCIARQEINGEGGVCNYPRG